MDIWAIAIALAILFGLWAIAAAIYFGLTLPIKETKQTRASHGCRETRKA